MSVEFVLAAMTVAAVLLAVAVVVLRARLREEQQARRDAAAQLDLARAIVTAGADEDATVAALVALRAELGATRLRFFVDGDRAPWLVTVEEDRVDQRDERPGRRDPLSIALVEGQGRSGVHVLRTDAGAVGSVVVEGDEAAMARAGTSLVLERLTAAATSLNVARESRTRASRLATDVERLDDITNATSDGVVLLNGSGRVVAWNRAMEQLTWRSAADALLHRWDEVLHLERSDGDILWDPLAAATDGARAEVLRLARRAAEHRWVLVSASPAGSDNGRAGAVLVLRDVTDQEEAESLKADFLATVSHELRTPLTPLKGFLEVIDRMGPALDEQHLQRAHAAMLRQVRRLEALVGDLLLTSELDRGAVNIHRSVVDIAEVTRRVVAELDPGAQDRVTLRAEQVRAPSDERALGKIVAILVSNALTHADGPVDLRVWEEGGAAHVAVRDHGEGIPEAMHAYVFERFARLGSHLRRAQGPGLGLPIADQLAQLLGAEIGLESVIGDGATFTLTLPLQPSAGASVDAQEVLDG